MSPSRRATVRAIAAAATLSVAGCTAIDGSGGAETDAPPSASASGTVTGFSVRLDGPETTRFLFDASDVTGVGAVRERRADYYYLSVQLTESATQRVTDRFRAAGVAADTDAFELVERHDGEVVGRFDISQGLADAVESGDWDGALSILFETRERAAAVRAELAETATP